MSKKESKKNEDRKDLIDDYYYMTMFDLANDTDLRDVKNLLKDYEDRELYEECAGIHKAVDTYEFISNFYKITESKNLSDKIQFKNDKIETDEHDN